MTFPEGGTGLGGVEPSGLLLALTAPWTGTFPWGTLRFPPHSFPRPGKAGKASFLPLSSTSI